MSRATTSHPSSALSHFLDELSRAPHSRRGSGFTPNFDVHETPQEYVLEGELPGLEDKKALTIEFTDEKTLHIAGKIERNTGSKKEGEGVKYWVSERSVGNFERSFTFPEEVDLEGVKAGLEDGVVRVRVPKREKRKERFRITVE